MTEPEPVLGDVGPRILVPLDRPLGWVGRWQRSRPIRLALSAITALVVATVLIAGLPGEERVGDGAEWAEVLPRSLVSPTTTGEPATTTTGVVEREPDLDLRGEPTSDLLETTSSTTSRATPEAPPSSVEAGQDNAAAGGPSGEIAAGFASRINQLRSGSGLPPLAEDGSLDAAAMAWAEWLARQGTLTHSDLGRLMPPWSAVAENLGAGSSVDGIFSSLAGSEAHRANMLGDYTRIGVGAWVDGAGVIWTVHLFAR